MMDLYLHIGLEIHCELKTNTKMFSSSPIDYQASPNTLVQPFDVAFPGTLPTINQGAVELALRACDVLNCTIDSNLRFDRKHYFYPDLPKGYQITQAFHPLGKDGFLTINSQKILIERVHLEEDTAKLVHRDGYTSIDFNRCGIPLIEIVTRPVITSVEDACAFMAEILRLVTYLEISEGKMEKGQVRCDVNLSLSEDPSDLGTKVEIKNLNSISHMRAALCYEVDRQKERIAHLHSIESQTRRYNEKEKKTVFLRAKNRKVDYRYMPDPNLPCVRLSREWIQEVLSKRPRTYQERFQQLTDKHRLSNRLAYDLLKQKEINDLYFEIVKYTRHFSVVANLLCADIRTWLKNHSGPILVKPEDIAFLINEIDRTIPYAKARGILKAGLEGKSIQKEWKAYQNLQLSSQDMDRLIQQTLAQNPKSVHDYLQGKDRALAYLVGQCMRLSKGNVDPQRAKNLLRRSICNLERSTMDEEE